MGKKIYKKTEVCYDPLIKLYIYIKIYAAESQASDLMKRNHVLVLKNI